MSQKVAYLKAPGQPLVVEEAPIPAPATGEIVVRNKFAAINPVDHIIQAYGFKVREFPVILGLDVAGEVVAVGEGVTNFAKGDHVLGMTESVFAPKQDKGGFQEYSAVRTLTAAKVPLNVSLADASTVALAALTAGYGLFESLALALEKAQVPQLPLNGKTVFIWGGSSCVGSYAIQLAVAAGYGAVTATSKKNFAMVEALGATAIDYTAASVVEDGVAALKGKTLAGTFIGAASGVSFEQAAAITEALEGQHKLVSAPLLPKDFSPSIPAVWVNINLEGYSPEVTALCQYLFWDYIPKGLAAGSLQVVPAATVAGKGVASFQDAVTRVLGGMSAGKLVVEL